MKNFVNKFPERLKELRTENKYTQKSLAEILGFKRSAITDWENRGTQPNIETLAKIAILFNISVDYLIGLED